MVWTGRYWKKYICPHPLKFSNFFHDNRPDIRPDIRYPACRISGTCNRISGRIPDSKKGRISGATLVPRRGISEPRHVWRNPSTQDIYGLVARRIFITVCTVLLYSGTHQGPNILQCPNTEIYSTFVYIPHPPFYFLEFSLLYISHEASPREERKGVTDYVLCTINNTNSSFLF